MRYELPPGLLPEEVRAIEAALDEYFHARAARPDPWALAGRVEALGLGALEMRHRAGGAWTEAARRLHCRPGTWSLPGRGDAA